RARPAGDPSGPGCRARGIADRPHGRYRAALRPDVRPGDIIMQPLRIGILGAANIARQFAAGCAPSQSVKIVAIASRGQDKADAMAAELDIGRALGSYEALLTDPDVEAIYIPLPNSLHADWTIQALNAGKHVLCEKPLAMDAAEARAMF